MKIELIELPLVPDHRGNLTFIESNRHVPFPINRVYYLYDIPGGSVRAGHAHYELEQLLVPLAGSFDVLLDNGTERKTVTLNRPHIGLRISSMTWRELHNFSSGAVCLVLASTHYEEADYIRDYDEFLTKARGQ
jgi:hypothetical protein